MSLLDRIFGRKPQQPIRDVAALAAQHSAPALHLQLSQAVTRSHVGGDPHLPAGTEWPTREGVQLDFLARFSLAEVHRAMQIDWLPGTGALLFFYDLERQPWGFDPADRGSWCVLHVNDSDMAQESSDDPASEGKNMPFRYLKFVPIRSLPSWERPSIRALDLNDVESDELMRIADRAFGERPKHQLAGFPSPVQGDEMELEAQLVSNGLYCGDASGYKDPRASALQRGAADWRLLFQFDTDDDLDVMWGDVGTLYFWVQEAHAKVGNFRDVWLIQQCH